MALRPDSFEANPGEFAAQIGVFAPTPEGGIKPVVLFESLSAGGQVPAAEALSAMPVIERPSRITMPEMESIEPSTYYTGPDDPWSAR